MEEKEGRQMGHEIEKSGKKKETGQKRGFGNKGFRVTGWEECFIPNSSTADSPSTPAL